MNDEEQAFTAMDALALTLEQFGVEVIECDPYEDYDDE